VKRENAFVEHTLHALQSLVVANLVAVLVGHVEHISHTLPLSVHLLDGDAEVELMQSSRDLVEQSHAIAREDVDHGVMK